MQPQNSIRLAVIPADIGEKVLDEMNIDDGIRTIVAGLLRHGYDTSFSCEGHNSQPYISFRKGTGDGTFEREAHKYGLQARKENSCCRENTEPFCPKCGASKQYATYVGDKKKTFSLQL